MQHQKDPNLFSITEIFNPLYRRANKKKSQFGDNNQTVPTESASKQVNIDPSIYRHFQQIHLNIGCLQQLFKTRMRVHEDELIKIAHSQLKKILLESQKVIQKYSKLIEQRNISHEILDLKYEIVYYQKRASDYYQENCDLRSTIKKLKEQVRSLKIGEESSHFAMQNISKKYIKEKTLKQKLLFNYRRDLNSSQLSNKRLYSLTKIQDPQKKQGIVAARLFNEKLKTQPTQIHRSQSEDKTRDVSFLINKLKVKSYISSSP